MAEFIEILSPTALADLQKGNAEIVTMIANIDKVGQKMAKISTPSGGDAGIKGLTASYVKQEEAISKLQIAIEKVAQAQNRTKISNNAVEKSNLSLEASIERKNKALDREQAKLTAAQNLYNKTQKQVNVLTQAYNDLMIRKLRYDNLNANEEKRLLTLQRVTERYNTTLKAVDATVGKHTRNVGNYAGAFNPLSNSINQLTREMPAFTYSVQTGFMALSNNIPIFTDAIKNAIDQNKILQAEGKPTTSVLKQLAGAFLSWQTLLGVGITLLTVYGKEIGEWIGSLTKGSNALDSVKESQKQLNDASQEGAKNAVQETLKLQSLLAIAKDTTLTYQQRMIAVKELQETYPAYFNNLKTEEILAGNTAKAEKELTDAILSRAKANAAVSKITENQAKIIDVELQRMELRNKLEATRYTITQLQELQNQGKLKNINSLLILYRKEESLISEINKLSGEKASLDKINNTLTSFALEKQKEAILLDFKETKGKKEKKKVEDDLLFAQTNSKIAFEENIKAIEETLNGISRESAGYGVLAGQLQLLKDIYEQLYATKKKANDEDFILLTDEQVFYDVQNEAELTAKALIALQKATDDWLKQLQSDAFNQAFDNIGLSAAKMFFDFDENGMSTFDKLFKGADTLGEKFAVTFQAVGDVAQNVFNKITEMQNQRFENAFNNLEREKEIAIAFAGESATARAEILEQYDERRRQIEKKQAESQKKAAIFNAIIDTAQGVVSAISRVDLYPYNFVLAGIIGALGAAQIAMISSQQIPQYWQGTDNAQEGLAWTQERGREIITDKQGKIKSLGSDKGATLTKLDKGDKVFTASESALMFNDNLNQMLLNNGIAMPKVEVNNSGLTDKQVGSIVSAIQNKTEYTPIIDKNGFNDYVRNGNTIKQNMNNRFNGIGKNV
jgi:hypothetical protein